VILRMTSVMPRPMSGSASSRPRATTAALATTPRLRLRCRHRARRADPYLRARPPRGAQTDAQPDPAALPAPRSRRPQAHPPARRAWRGRRNRARPDLPWRQRPSPRNHEKRGRLRRPGQGRHGLHRRHRDRWTDRSRAARPAHPLGRA
jgi:hypothetical protein